MVPLFLSDKISGEDDDDKNDDGGKDIVVPLLQELGSVVWSVITADGRSECRLWLCNAISSIRSISRREKRCLFKELLDSSKQRREIAAQLMQLVLEKMSQKAAALLCKKSHILEDFFRGSSARILQWFGNSGSSGKYENSKGARALSKFAFVNRDVCWDELEWKGKHGQSPAMVATKPHYFLDLDVSKTVENFLEYVPDFWTSDELAESLRDGEIFHIDTNFFVDEFTRMIYEENSADIWDIVDEYIIDEEFSFLCKHLLVLLNENELFTFLCSIAKVLSSTSASMACLHTDVALEKHLQSSWLEYLLSSSISKSCLDDLLLLNAVVNEGRQILRQLQTLLQTDELIDERAKLDQLLPKINASRTDSGFGSRLKECTRMDKLMAMKTLGLESFALHFILSSDFKTPDSWESLFTENEIGFRKSAKYSLVSDAALLNEEGFIDDSHEAEHQGSSSGRKKKKRKKKHSRHKSGYDDELEEIEFLGQRDVISGKASWLISTDDYSSIWNIADLPEYLAKYCFSTWLKWFLSMRHTDLRVT